MTVRNPSSAAGWRPVVVESSSHCLGCDLEILAGRLGYENPTRFGGYLCPVCVRLGKFRDRSVPEPSAN
jgi:hypothetical protein